MPITTPKLVDLAPTWAELRGWTVLFDNPVTDGLDQPIRRLSSSLGDPAMALFGHLADVAAQLHIEFRDAGLAWLPPDTYHVTLMDGLSDLHVDRLEPGLAAALRSELDAAPNSLDDPAPMLLGSGAAVESLTSAPIAVRYGVTRVTCRGHAVLAELAPSGPSATAHEEITAIRSDVLGDLSRRTGIELSTPFRPHVTLGYVGDRAVAAKVAEPIGAAAAPLVEGGTGLEIEFRSASIYMFTSMADYYFLAGSDPSEATGSDVGRGVRRRLGSIRPFLFRWSPGDD